MRRLRLFNFYSRANNYRLFLNFAMKDGVAASAQAGQIIKMLQFVSTMIVAPMMSLKVVLAVADLAAVASPLLYGLADLLPVIAV